MGETFTYQISDLDGFVSEPLYAYAEIEDPVELAEILEDSLLLEQPALNNSGFVLVIADAVGSPLLFRPLGRIH